MIYESLGSYTPGPWKVCENWRSKLAVIGPQPEGCNDTTTNRICNLPHRQDKQGRANAQLIAAAPDMLALLIALHDHGYSSVGDHERVRDVIGKARGERS